MTSDYNPYYPAASPTLVILQEWLNILIAKNEEIKNWKWIIKWENFQL